MEERARRGGVPAVRSVAFAALLAGAGFAGFAGCAPPADALQPEPAPPVIAYATPSSNNCYIGAEAGIGYDVEIPWDTVALLWSRHGWSESVRHFPRTDHQVMGDLDRASCCLSRRC